MKNSSILVNSTLAMILATAHAAAQADRIEDQAIAKARQDYEAAMQGNDAGLQNAKKIQLAVLLAKAQSNNGDAGKTTGPEMPLLARELNCVACHAIDHKLVGPAWQDVANRYTGKGVTTYTYKGKQSPLIEGLVMKVSKGGSGNWGTMPMPANDPTGVKQAKITELVKFEQSLAKK